jgi:RNA polymerase sigma-70 factor (ECF subfamily)
MSETHNNPHLSAIEALYSGHHGWLYATLKRKLRQHHCLGGR